MIVTIRDITYDTQSAAVAAALISSLTAIGKSKRTLVMQLTGPTEDNPLDILVGRDLKGQIVGEYVFADDGIDGLSIRAGQNRLVKENFDECVTPILNKENMLDALKVTKTEHFVDVIGIETMEKIIESAKDIYNYIYIVLPQEDKDLVKRITKMSDEDLVLVPQGRDVQIKKIDKKTFLIVKDFEPASKFDLSAVRNRYGVKKIYAIPHSVALNDNVISQTLLDFVFTNKKDIKEDSNYSFFHSLLNIVNRYVVDKEDDEVEEKPTTDGYDKISSLDIMAAEEPEEIHAGTIQEVSIKKGFFSRRKTKMMVVDADTLAAAKEEPGEPNHAFDA